MLKKIEIAKKIIELNIDKFICPKCGEKFLLRDNSVICKINHCFDISKKGTVNFLYGKTAENYSAELFRARKKIILSGFYAPLTECLDGMLKGENILDAGCGEGSFSKLMENEERTFFGIDIAKEGINLASEYSGNFYAVADLVNLPFADKSMDTVLDIFSPSNYAEFKRVLKDDGVLVKVVPNKGYLKEIREFYDINTEYDNTSVLDVLKKNFTVTEQKRVCYTAHISEENIPNLLRMTPLMWNRDDFGEFDKMEITVDVTAIKAYK